MLRSSAIVLLAGMLLASCGTPMAAPVATVNPIHAATSAKKVHQPSFEQGRKAGEAKALSLRSNAIGLEAAPTDPSSYQHGDVVGILEGTLKTFNRIEGSYDAAQWKAFAYSLLDAMKDAHARLGSDPALASKYAEASGILSGGIRSFMSIKGSFDVHQWQSFTSMNHDVLRDALTALTR